MTKPILSTFPTLAPMIIAQYERYLPTAFDESMTLVEKVNKVIIYLNQIGEITNDVVDQWNTVVGWVMSDGLTESVSAKIDDMIANGTFDDIINGTTFLEFNTRLDDLAVNVKYFDTPSVAVAYAYTNNRKLDWGNGTTVVTDSIPNLHDIESVGTGKIQRGSDIYYVNPVDVQENKIYVSSSIGNDLNDGLSLTTSLRTIQKAFDILAKHAKPILKGSWRVIISSGSYNHSSLETDLLSENPISIEGQDVGGHPGAPTTIITDGSGFSSYGIWLEGKVNVIVKNIKITGYNGTSSSAGIYASDRVSLTTSNVHTSGNYWGISGQTSNIEIPDGIHENNGYLPNGTGNGGAIRSLQLNRHHIGNQNATSVTDGAIIRNNKTGVFIQENSTGHVDWVTISGNEDGIYLNVNSRANADGTTFTNNQRAIRLIGNSHVFTTTNNVFTGNLSNVVNTSGGQANIPNVFDVINPSYSTMDNIVDTKYVNTNVSSVVSLPVYTSYLKTPFWNNEVNSITPIKKLEVKIIGNITGGVGTKQINMRVGSDKAGISLPANEVGPFHYTGFIFFVNPTTQFLFLEGNTHLNTNKQGRTIVSNPTTADIKLTIEGQTADVTDVIHFDMIEIKFAG
jgi:hypothetical protein